MKPSLRGVSHQIAAVVAFIAGVALVATAPNARAAWAAAIYAFSLTAMFTISAAYHRPTWQPKARQWMRRLDHAGIFILIAGTCTPMGVLLQPQLGDRVLYVAWGGAILGTLQSLFWVTAPKTVASLLYLAMGWVSVLFMPPLYRISGWSWVTLFAVGGIFYSVGAVAYALKRPNPFPKVFGYHEVFHALVILAGACHFVAEAGLIQRIG